MRIRGPKDLEPAVIGDVREELLLVLDRLACREPERGEDVCARIGQQLHDRVPLPPNDDATLNEEQARRLSFAVDLAGPKALLVGGVPHRQHGIAREGRERVADRIEGKRGDGA